MMSGRSRLDVAASMGISFRKVERPKSKVEAHQAVRKLFPNFLFCSQNARLLIEAIEGYKYKWNDKTMTFSTTPEHNWSSHMADALQTLAVGYRTSMESGKKPGQRVMSTNYSVWNL
jgi:hypothetical protein